MVVGSPEEDKNDDVLKMKKFWQFVVYHAGQVPLVADGVYVITEI
jgi:hypothetical protein